MVFDPGSQRRPPRSMQLRLRRILYAALRALSQVERRRLLTVATPAQVRRLAALVLREHLRPGDLDGLAAGRDPPLAGTPAAAGSDAEPPEPVTPPPAPWDPEIERALVRVFADIAARGYILPFPDGLDAAQVAAIEAALPPVVEVQSIMRELTPNGVDGLELLRYLGLADEALDV